MSSFSGAMDLGFSWGGAVLEAGSDFPTLESRLFSPCGLALVISGCSLVGALTVLVVDLEVVGCEKGVGKVGVGETVAAEFRLCCAVALEAALINFGAWMWRMEVFFCLEKGFGARRGLGANDGLGLVWETSMELSMSESLREEKEELKGRKWHNNIDKFLKKSPLVYCYYEDWMSLGLKWKLIKHIEQHQEQQKVFQVAYS